MNENLWLDPAISVRVCLTLLHSLWEVILLAAVAWLADRMCKRSVERRYAVHVAALLICLVALPVTYVLVEVSHDLPVADGRPIASQSTAPQSAFSFPVPTAADVPQHANSSAERAALMGSSDAVPPAETNSTDTATASFSPIWKAAPNWVVALYALGVLIMLARLARGLSCACRQASNATTIQNGPVAELLTSLARQYSMRIVPALAIAKRSGVPQVMGLLRPIILLPASSITGLSTDELGMILSHELAHIRRHDLWVNLLQRLAETLLFFNPAVWYLTRRISTLREFCCDELACRTLAPAGQASRTRYAAALLRVAELSYPARNASGELAALAATGPLTF